MPLVICITYSGKPGKARAFANEMVKSGVVSRIRNEPGNLGYRYYVPLEDSNESIVLIDRWKDHQALDEHHASKMMEEILALREKYGLTMKAEILSDTEG